MAAQLWEDPGLVAELRCARDWGAPWGVFRGRRAPGGPWTDEDRRAALLLADYEATVCGGCGQPHHLAHDPDLSERWGVEPVLCFACAARDERAQRVHANEANEQPGAFTYAIRLTEPRRKGVASG